MNDSPHFLENQKHFSPPHSVVANSRSLVGKSSSAVQNVFNLILRGDYVVNHGDATQLSVAKMHLKMDYPTPRNFCYTFKTWLKEHFLPGSMDHEI